MSLPNFRNDLSALIELLPESATVVELGSFAGASARSFLASPKVKRLFCVDWWEAGYDAADLASGADMQAAEKAFDDIRDPRVIKLKTSTANAAGLFPDRSIDLVYIDADHRFEGVVADIRNWRPKVKRGGYLAGHDYGNKDHPGVAAAVDLWTTMPATLPGQHWAMKVIE